MIKMLGMATGAVTSAVGTAVCCSGPFLVATFGISGAGLSAIFRPYRPFFVVSATLLIWFGFHILDKLEADECDPEKPCADPVYRRRMKTMMWGAAVLVLLIGTFPRWSLWII